MPRTALLILSLLSLACQPKAPPASTQPLAPDLETPQPIPALDAHITPPKGWIAEEIRQDNDNTRQVWKSPTGDTAYGIIYFGLPLPVPASWVYPRFVAEMGGREKEATVIAGPDKDDSLPGLRFTVDSGDYRMRINLITHGFHGWAVYAGTLRDRPERPAEVELAERARDRTSVGTVR